MHVALNKMMKKILLIEDDIQISFAWSIGLAQAGYLVKNEDSELEAINTLKKNEFDAILLDINLKSGNGLNIIKWMNQSKYLTPLIVITAQLDERTAIKSLTLGAADYVRKPIGINEIVIRLDRLLNNDSTVNKKYKQYHDLKINFEIKEVIFNGKLIELSPSEYKIFKELFLNVNHPVPRENLLNALDLSNESFDRTVDSHISRIRKKISDFKELSINSVWGNGYTLKYENK
jgi:DNA-binding response OmpR family regulator